MRFSAFGLLIVSSLLLLLAAPALGNEKLKSKTFHFGTHPARTNISFVSEADFETINGTSNAIQGSVSVDASGTKASGSLKVGVRTLKTGIPLRDTHLQSSDWLDAARFPYIELDDLIATEGKDGKTWSYKGKLKIKGVVRDVSGTGRVIAIPKEIAEKNRLGAGDWVHVRATFKVKLSDHGVNVDKDLKGKVSDEWDVKVDLFGTTARPARRN